MVNNVSHMYMNTCVSPGSVHEEASTQDFGRRKGWVQHQEGEGEGQAGGPDQFKGAAPTTTKDTG